MTAQRDDAPRHVQAKPTRPTNWVTEWRAISGRIEGLAEATTLFFHGLSVQNSDGYKIKQKHLWPAARRIFASIQAFQAEHGPRLPPNAQMVLSRFLLDGDSLLTNADLDNIGAVMAGATALTAFRSELAYELADLEASVLRLSERAFAHLQRLIVADDGCRSRWHEAFKSGEVACERLGSAHLLQHGIWAFKVSATGERTDLVFAEPLPVTDDVATIAEGLLLTEWKVVRDPAEQQAQLAQAQAQAELYAAGVLGGIELRGYRYLVMVSAKRLPMPDDQEVGGVRYRAVNIAVDPDVPSRTRPR